MAPVNIEPLDAVTWFASVERLHAGQGGKTLKIANRLRLAFYLSNLAPPPLAQIAASGLSEVAFERLLRASAYESAAMALVGSSLAFEVVSDRPAGRFAAKVTDGGVTGYTPGREDSVASALLQAWVNYLLALRDSCLAEA